ncbi:hypothetical protein OOT46_30425 [Aquabacterium sp. A7-Y]|uniref:hypothetical protein n=1 Tax=Aquabacterium sp. A7-Y TaxID=1349605 RepID=UPI00223D7F10|nr:hypothetical protein [Aquabacterium sp. A7-Y]MCW7542115.1 hypothetical protein [Aquabacterium sp. A7-Y]
MEMSQAASLAAVMPAAAPVSPAGAGAAGPGRADAVARFETLLYAPGGATPATTAALDPTLSGTALQNTGGVRAWAHGLSQDWRKLESSVARLSATQELSARDLMALQYQVTTASVSLELSSKSAGMVERDVQSLLQRS